MSEFESHSWQLAAYAMKTGADVFRNKKQTKVLPVHRTGNMSISGERHTALVVFLLPFLLSAWARSRTCQIVQLSLKMGKFVVYNQRFK